MYIPKHYQGKNTERAVAFMQRFNFATIVSSNADVPTATHLPFVIREVNGDIQISSHFAKANPHWEHIGKEQDLIIFTEPHAYISTEHYEKDQNVPTWNYLAVHAYGTAKIIDGRAEVFKLLESMMESFEPAYKKQWQKLPDEYREGMANGIVAFEMKVTELQFKEKLSQNKKDGERASIIRYLGESPAETERILAEYMKRHDHQ